MVSKRLCLRALAIILVCVCLFVATCLLQPLHFDFFTTRDKGASLVQQAPDIGASSGPGPTSRDITPAIQKGAQSRHARKSSKVSAKKTTKQSPSSGMRWLPPYSEKNYRITLTSDTLCQRNKTVRLLVFVLSSVKNFRRREAIRKSWASPALNATTGFRVGFMLGSTSNTSLQEALRREARDYGDIVQVDYLEDYYKITLSSITALRWATQNCPSYEYLVKADDDSFLRMGQLYEYLKRTKPSKCVLGIVCRKNRPNRVPTSKWYTPPSMYNKTYLPDFTKGFVYVVTADVVPEIYGAAQQLRVFPFEDVFVTGMCRERTNATVQSIPNFVHTRLPPTGCSFRNLMAGHRVSGDEMVTIWRQLQDKDLKCAAKKKKV